MNEAERQEFNRFKEQLEEVTDDVLPIVNDITVHTRRARGAMGGLTENEDGEIVDKLVDTLVLSNEQVELAILLQRIGDRISTIGYITRGMEEFYKRVMEGHKVRLTRVGVEKTKQVKDPDSTTGFRTETVYETVAAGVADSMKIELAHEAFALFNECQKRMDMLINIRKSTDKTIDTVRSKLSYEKRNEDSAR